MGYRFRRIAAAVALLLGSSAVMPIAESRPAQAQISSNCQVWTTTQEEDGSGAANLTASACAATADDPTAVGVQCSHQPEIRF